MVLVLPGGKANLEFVRLVVEEKQAGRALGLDELLVLNGLWQERQLDTEQLAGLIHGSAHSWMKGDRPASASIRPSPPLLPKSRSKW